MLLVEITIGGVLHRISNEWLELDHLWSAHVASIGSLRIGYTSEHGGYWCPDYGSIEILPSLFDSFPQVSCPIKVMFAVADESDAVVLMDGYAHLTTVTADSVVYDLYRSGENGAVTDGTVLSGTLLAVFTAQCSALGLTMSNSSTRASSLYIDHTVSGDTTAIDLLDDIAAFFCHGFRVDNGVMYLVDLLSDNGSTTLTEFDMFPGEYGAPAAIAQISCGDSYVSSWYLYGQNLTISTPYNTNPANVTPALSDMRTLLSRDFATIYTPLSGGLVAPSQKISATIEDGLEWGTSLWVRAHAVTWDFDQEQAVIEGRGEIS